MFNRNKCKKCIYHGLANGISTHTDTKVQMIYCNYATVTDKTCLRRVGFDDVIDIRGDDPENCLLFKAGRRKRVRRDIGTY